MIRRPPRSTRTDTLVTYTTLFRSWRRSLIGNMDHLDAGAIGEDFPGQVRCRTGAGRAVIQHAGLALGVGHQLIDILGRSEEHTSELQSLMRTSYAVFCMKKTKNAQTTPPSRHNHRPKRTMKT